MYSCSSLAQRRLHGATRLPLEPQPSLVRGAATLRGNKTLSTVLLCNISNRSVTYGSNHKPRSTGFRRSTWMSAILHLVHVWDFVRNSSHPPVVSMTSTVMETVMRVHPPSMPAAPITAYVWTLGATTREPIARLEITRTPRPHICPNAAPTARDGTNNPMAHPHPAVRATSQKGLGWCGDGVSQGSTRRVIDPQCDINVRPVETTGCYGRG